MWGKPILIPALALAFTSCQDGGRSALAETTNATGTAPESSVRNGEKRTFHASGALEWQYNYSNDTLEGPAVYFDSLSHKREEHWYSRGVLKSLVVYDQEGLIVDSDFRWKEEEIPLFAPSQIELTTGDTILHPGTEYKFRIKVPGIPYIYFQPSVTNATIAKATEDLFVVRTKNGPTTCIKLMLSVRDSLKIPFGERCFDVVPSQP
jgi:hypothetical protein